MPERQDVDVNSAGELTPRQRLHFITWRAAEHAFGALVAMLVIALLIHQFRLTPDLTAIGAVVIVVVGIALVLFVIHIRTALKSPVQSVRGIAMRRVLGDAAMQPFYCVTIGDTLFYVDEAKFRSVEDDAEYDVFFVSRPAHVGGGVWLSARKTDIIK